jgi:rSAM/selenodomain-associated transferase 1
MERLILFAKTPRLHRVKTRLAPRLTPQQALLLHEAMLEDQLRFVRRLASNTRTGEVCLDRPWSPRGALQEAAAELPRTEQGAGDLGERMIRALARAFAEGAGRAAILGADAPTIPRALVDEAFALLARGSDAVVIPAEDGGYVLVGASHPVPALFEEVPWGTPSVLETTRRLAREAGLVLAETAPWPDVDVESDLPRLAAGLAADPSRAPATALVVARLGLYAPRNPVV